MSYIPLLNQATLLLMGGVLPSEAIERLRISLGVTTADATNAVETAAQTLIAELRVAKREISMTHDLFETLRILRSANSTSRQINSIKNIDAKAFYSDYVQPNKPLLMPGFCAGWPAVNKWSPQWFKKSFGACSVEIMTNRGSNKNYDRNRSAHKTNIRLGDFIDHLEAEFGNDKYMTGANGNLFEDQFNVILNDIIMPPAFFKQVYLLRLIGLWVGGAGTVTALHYDRTNNILCQIYGTKRVTMVPALEKHLVGGSEYYFSEFDPESPAHRDIFSRTTTMTCEINPGDALFIPVGWWHHVRSLSKSISIALNNLLDPNEFPL